MNTPTELAKRWKALGRRRFSEAEDAVVIGMAPYFSLRQIAEKLDRPVPSIQTACRRLRIKTVGANGEGNRKTRNKRKLIKQETA